MEGRRRYTRGQVSGGHAQAYDAHGRSHNWRNVAASKAAGPYPSITGEAPRHSELQYEMRERGLLSHI